MEKLQSKMQAKALEDVSQYGELSLALPIVSIEDVPKQKIKKLLHESLGTFGILSPVVVIEISTDPIKYAVVDGRKRVQFVRSHGGDSIPALVLSGRIPKSIYNRYKDRQFKAEKLYPEEYQQEVYQLTRSTNPNYSAIYKNKQGNIVWRNKADVRKAVAKYRGTKAGRDKQYYLNDFSASKRFVGKAKLEDLKELQEMIDKKINKIQKVEE